MTYRLKNSLTIPSRNDQQLIEVARLDLQPEYFYKAVPVLTPHVYLLATLTNASEHVLLPGEATMYLGSDFVGRMNLPLVAIGEQFTAGFGVIIALILRLVWTIAEVALALTLYFIHPTVEPALTTEAQRHGNDTKED